MRNVVASVVALLTLMLFSAVAEESQRSKTRGNSGVEQYIKDLEGQTRDAALKGDSSFMELHTTTNYYRVGPDGSVATREQFLKVSAREKFFALDVVEQNIFVYGNSAIVIEKASLRGVGGDGRTIDGDYRVTRVWIKENGQWKLAASHITRMKGNER